MYRRTFWLVVLLACPLSSRAQAPKWFASAGTGIQTSGFLVDDPSGSSWDFDAGFGVRLSLERQFSQQLAAGIVFNRARLPLQYDNLANATGGTCTPCAADATVASYGALFRYGGGRGLHQVIEVFAGALRYGNFTETQGGTSLPPTSNTDLAFGAGYGFGFNLASDWQVTLMQDAFSSVHERSTLAQAGGRINRHFMTRLTLRVGF